MSENTRIVGSKRDAIVDVLEKKLEQKHSNLE